MGFYKTTQKAALDAWDNEINQRIALKEKADAFAKKFGGKPVFSSDITRHRFYGLTFDSTPLIGHDGMWVEALPQVSFTRRPRQKGCVPHEHSYEHQKLLDAWDTGYPSERISREPYWKALGLDWGMLIIGRITHFRVGDVIYFKTDVTPSPDSGATEIVESEYKAAEKTIS
ncbi:TPA: hypothetical protein ACQ2HX_000194 [Klebsiella pneumoniae]